MNQHIDTDLTSASDVDDVMIISEINRIQAYLQSFEYNYLGQPFFVLKRSTKTVSYIHEQAKLIIKCKMPIQCVEAVFIGCLLTSKPHWRIDRGSDNTLLTRIPISFKSKFQRKTYRHIVLFLKHKSKWGSIGMSRRATLMNKPMIYTSLLDLLKEFQSCYNQLDHTLCAIYLGSPIPHVSDNYSVLEKNINNGSNDKVHNSNIPVSHDRSSTINNNQENLLKCPVRNSTSRIATAISSASVIPLDSMSNKTQSIHKFNSNSSNTDRNSYDDYLNSSSSAETFAAVVNWRAYKLILPRHSRIDALDNHIDQINQYLELYNITSIS